MNNKVLWIIAVIGTLASATYQRLTGPTHPLRTGGELGATRIATRLPRSHSISSDMTVRIEVDDPEVRGSVTWRRYPTGEDWTTVPMRRADGALAADLPAQPSAGKVEYSVMLTRGEESLRLPDDEAVVARFKGDVPLLFLLPHILCMFLAMLLSIRTFLEAVTGGPRRLRLARATLAFLFVGGLILGPIVQKYAFGAFWTGWPLGEDLTDNKLLASVLAYVWAATRGPGKRFGRTSAIVAGLILMAAYMIPHSMHGSTLDYESMETISG